jgi:thiol-disulfide isomerase/thioredoxin
LAGWHWREGEKIAEYTWTDAARLAGVKAMMRFSFAAIVLCVLTSAARAQDAVKIGAAVGKLKFTDIRGLPRSLDDFGKKKAYVLVFTNTSCPLAKRYLPTLTALDKEYAAKDVQFVGVNSADEDSLIAMATQAVQFDVAFPFVKDFGGVCARALGVRRTPEAVILDGDKRLRYRGRIDDQYRLGGVRKEPTSRDLQDALDAVLAGKQVAKAETEVDGCPITFAKERKPRDVNFAEHVAPILQKHCWSCHQTGGSGPFALTSYKQTSSRAETIAEVVAQQRMPPWFASHEFGPFVNRRGLSDEEREIIADWVRIGTPQGDAKKAPAVPKQAASKWVIGEPDLVLQTGEFELPAKGDIPYKYAILPHVFTEDTWVQYVQILPDNPRALHHGNMLFVNLADGFNEKNFITGQVPGGEPMALDDGTGFLIPKGSAFGLELHFVATGKVEKCKVSVGLRYPRVVVEKRLQMMKLADRRFAIAPGAPAHKVAASRVLDRNVVGVGLFSHMHVRGKDMTFKATASDGKTDTLLVIPNYSFSWQIPYRWEPGKMRFAKGTRLDCVAHFDNSPFNPYNPDPLATVRFGLQTHEEMMYGFFFYTDAAEQLGLSVDPKTGVERKKAEK